MLQINDLIPSRSTEVGTATNAAFRPAVARLFFETRSRQTSLFELSARRKRRASAGGHALTTMLLVIYPLFASAAVVIAGFMLTGGA